MKKDNIGIIGCGWLGLPLAKQLIFNGYSVHGTTTSASKIGQLASEGINPFTVVLDEKGISGDMASFLKTLNTLIINIPPGLRKQPNKNHVKEIEVLISEIENHDIKKVVYVSSTSVFKDDIEIPLITEQTKPNGITNTAKQLIEIEDMLQKNTGFNTNIIRFGGLIDAHRHPAKLLAGRSGLKNGNAPINLIHKTDCIGIITRLIENNVWGVEFNAVYPFHPSKKDYYTAYCKANNLQVPTYDTSPLSKGKIIDSSFLAQQLPYTFAEPI